MFGHYTIRSGEYIVWKEGSEPGPGTDPAGNELSFGNAGASNGNGEPDTD